MDLGGGQWRPGEGAGLWWWRAELAGFGLGVTALAAVLEDLAC